MIVVYIRNLNGDTLFTNENIIQSSFSFNRYSSSAVAPEFGNVSAGELLFSIDTSTTNNTVERGDVIRLWTESVGRSNKECFEGDGIRKAFSVDASSIESVYVDGEKIPDTDYAIVREEGAIVGIEFSNAPADDSFICIYYTSRGEYHKGGFVGDFIVTKTAKRQGALDVTCLDRMIELDTKADLTQITFPITASDFIEQVYGTQLGLDYYIIGGYEGVVLDDPIFEEGITYRQVLSKVCECMGANAWYEKKLWIGWHHIVDPLLGYTEADYFSAELTEEGFDVEVECTDDFSLPSVEISNNVITLRIAGNEFLANKTAVQRREIAEEIKRNIGTDKWYGCNAVVLPQAMPTPAPYMIANINGKLVPITSVTMGINENVKLEAKITADDNFDYLNSTQRDIVNIKKEVANIEASNKHFFYRNDSGVHITMVENEPNQGRNTKIDSNYFYVRDGETILTRIGESSRFGQEGKGGLGIDDKNLTLYDAGGSTALRVALSSGSEEKAVQENHYHYNTYTEPTNYVFDLQHTPISSIDLFLELEGSTPLSEGEMGFGGEGVSFVEPLVIPINGQVVQDTFDNITVSAHYSEEDNTVRATVTNQSSTAITYVDFYFNYKYSGYTPTLNFGQDNVIEGGYSTALGKGLIINENGVAVGIANEELHKDWNFVVGVGQVGLSSETYNRYTGFAVRQNNDTEVLIRGAVRSDLIFQTGGGQEQTGYTSRIITQYSSSSGNDMLIHANGNLFVGGGEYANNRYNAGFTSTESTYLGADGAVVIETNANTIANRKTWEFNTSGSIVPSATRQGIYGKDSTGQTYPYVYDNGSNLWIGASQLQTKHHTGYTYISAGHNGTNGNGTIYVAVPNAGNTDATTHGVWHGGNLPITKGSGVTSIAIGDTVTTRVLMGGTSANKVFLGAQNNVDNKRYDIRAQADNFGLLNVTDESWVWRFTGLSGSYNIGTLNTTVSNLNTKVGNIGSVVTSNPADKSVATGTDWVNVGSIKLGAGVWIISLIVRWNTNANGVRSASISNTSGGAIREIQCTHYTSASTGTYTFNTITYPVSLSAETTLYYNVFQNSGGNLTAVTRSRAVRII